MKSFRNSLFLLALTSLPLTGADLFAQSADDAMRLGYCTTEYSSGLILQGVEGPGIYQAAAYFTSDLLDKYEGDKITAVEFAVKPKRGSVRVQPYQLYEHNNARLWLYNRLC